MGAISRNIKEELQKRNVRVRHIEGTPESRWVLLDCGDVIVHIFERETRNFYNLERLWGDAPVVKIKEEKRRHAHKSKAKKAKKKKKPKKKAG